MGAFPWPDLILILIVGFSAYAAIKRGFVAVLLSLLGFLVALLVSFNLYPYLAQWLIDRFGWSPVWAAPIAFVALWLIVEGIFGVIEALLHRYYGNRLYWSQVNQALAVIPGIVQGLLTAAVIFTLVALLPIQPAVRNSITQAPISGRLVQATLAIERPLEGIFGPAARQALGFFTTPNPATGGSGQASGGAQEGPVKLNFTVSDAKPDPGTEDQMLVLVNQERTSRGLAALTMDEPLRQLARAHADDMFKRGYFAHETPEGVDPFQRMQQANIPFTLAGENLALAPTLDIAHNGLMNSPGHRANILNAGFHKVGIGVLDGGIYGKMFVQEFTD